MQKRPILPCNYVYIAVGVMTVLTLFIIIALFSTVGYYIDLESNIQFHPNACLVSHCEIFTSLRCPTTTKCPPSSRISVLFVGFRVNKNNSFYEISVQADQYPSQPCNIPSKILSQPPPYLPRTAIEVNTSRELISCFYAEKNIPDTLSFRDPLVTNLWFFALLFIFSSASVFSCVPCSILWFCAVCGRKMEMPIEDCNFDVIECVVSCCYCKT